MSSLRLLTPQEVEKYTFEEKVELKMAVGDSVNYQGSPSSESENDEFTPLEKKAKVIPIGEVSKEEKKGKRKLKTHVDESTGENQKVVKLFDKELPEKNSQKNKKKKKKETALFETVSKAKQIIKHLSSGIKAYQKNSHKIIEQVNNSDVTVDSNGRGILVNKKQY